VPSKSRDKIRGVALVRFADGTEKMMPKISYFKMKEAGRNVVLVKEGLHYTDLK
jgi:hypothetical protein